MTIPATHAARTCLAVAREMVGAPFLPGIQDPADPLEALAQQPRERSSNPEFTGKIVLRDEERCLAVGAMRLRGESDREIARVLGLSRNSIPVIVEHLERTGQLEPLKGRLLRRIGDLVERAAIATDNLLDRVVDEPTSELAAALRAATNVLDVASEKHALLTGSPTNISATVQEVPSREEWDRWVRCHVVDAEEIEPAPASGRVTPDSESGEADCAATCCADPLPRDTPVDTS